MLSLLQISFLRFAHDNDLLAQLPVPAFMRQKLDVFLKDVTKFQQVYELEDKDVPLNAFTVNFTLKFDPVASIKQLRKHLPPVEYFALCAKYALADDARDVWLKMTQLERSVLVCRTYFNLQVSPVQAEAMYLAGELGNLEMPQHLDPFWNYVCASLYSAKKGWQYALERNFDRFSHQRQLYSEKAIECCLYAVKYGHIHVFMHIITSPKFTMSFLKPESFNNPCRNFSLLEISTQVGTIDEILLANLLCLALDNQRAREFVHNLLDWCLDDEYEKLRDFIAERVEDDTLRHRALSGLDILLSL
ncbi:hypothetical protein L596_017082 [Steinernema carpocapsae]|uniref:Uncharacterized protein n=1 Tax=Steinernema carpocapsae TaxID=34508 RepID=A0A4U5N0F7_STECR|nr:hypothetical protein L596_017082 [Steinernema carpocapsae]